MNVKFNRTKAWRTQHLTSLYCSLYSSAVESFASVVFNVDFDHISDADKHIIKARAVFILILSTESESLKLATVSVAVIVGIVLSCHSVIVILFKF